MHKLVSLQYRDDELPLSLYRTERSLILIAVPVSLNLYMKHYKHESVYLPINSFVLINKDCLKTLLSREKSRLSEGLERKLVLTSVVHGYHDDEPRGSLSTQ